MFEVLLKLRADYGHRVIQIYLAAIRVLGFPFQLVQCQHKNAPLFVKALNCQISSHRIRQFFADSEPYARPFELFRMLPSFKSSEKFFLDLRMDPYSLVADFKDK